MVGGLFLRYVAWKSHSPAPYCGTIASVAFFTVESEASCYQAMLTWVYVQVQYAGQLQFPVSTVKKAVLESTQATVVTNLVLYVLCASIYLYLISTNCTNQHCYW